ncbi:MAG: multiheme c-type cytochrome [Verrucomicrobia bacterium]|nr:multiheme c-type cytochrome [Verrucomicrobiota bacterium]
MKLTRPIIFLAATLAGLLAASAASVVNSKHNLSTSGPGAVIASTETEICIFCHTPHNSSTQAPLWNRFDSGASYTLYSSTTTKAVIGQPTGASKLCLGCHDGTVALGMVRSRAANIAMRNGVTTLPGTSAANLGTDLSDDHPISFPYNSALVSANGQLNSPPTTGKVHVDPNGSLQCTSCHEPHDPQYGSFLAVDNTASALCVTCHNMTYWSQTSHKTSTKTWNGTAPNPWPHTTNLTTVAANACENCHDPHGAGGKSRLMNYSAEEQNCYSCHNGNIVSPATKNVQADFSKASVHPITLTIGVHDATEITLVPSGTGHHVECEDCHNPHAAYPATGTLPGGLTGVRGVDITGGNLPTISHEYELCFRCHADTAKGPARVTRKFPNLNTRQEFQNSTGTNSFHPVIVAGRNSDVPSLKSPWTIASKTGCTDCHNSDTSPATGGTGANGPHGSAITPILERAMNLTDTRSTTTTAALCFKCHNFNWANNTDPFQSSGGDSLHNQHLAKNVSCTSCHDPHGSPQPHLINFDTTVVRAIGGVGPSYTWTGVRHGTCTLLCHGEDHTPKSY